MSAVLFYLPTATMQPLPRRANVGRLPAGIVRFSTYRRERARAAASENARSAQRAAAHAAYVFDQEARSVRIAELAYAHCVREGKPDTPEAALARVRRAVAEMRVELAARHDDETGGAA